jgi:MerR family redox-sensitive transcriptional activator SoxR
MVKLEVSFKSSTMTIGKLAKESGVPASTIRYWERIRVLPQPARVNHRRRYPPDAVNSLAVLRLAQACGFHLPEMRRLLHGFAAGVSPSSRWRELARQKQAELDTRMAQLLAMRRLLDRVVRCRCPDLNECGRRFAAQD